MFAALNSFLTRAVSGYFLNKSLRFRGSASAYLNRTFGTPTNNIKWTWSGWVKRGQVSGYQRIFGVGSDASGVNQGSLTFDTSNVLGFFQGDGSGGTEAYLVTNALYRDPAAWYHIVFVFDSANGTSSNRILLYINGAQVTSFSTATYPSSSLASKINANAVAHAIGVLPTSPSNFFDGEMAEVNFVDGQALAPTAFGAYSTYNQWLPIKYAGTYGTNGFYLPFNSLVSNSYAGSFAATSALSVPNSSALYLGGGSFAIECWIYPTASGSVYGIASDWTTGANPGPSNWLLDIEGSNINLYAVSSGNYYDAGGVNLQTSDWTTSNVWTHIAVTYDGTTLRLFVNGVVKASSAFSGLSTNAGSHSSTIYIASIVAGTAYFFPGYISNFRIVKGSAVYTTTFTPSTVPLLPITGTALLTLQNSTFIDNSINKIAITNINSATTSLQTPFGTPAVVDSSGNANNWTPNNISLTAGSTYDSLTDVPTLTSTTVANYAVLNPLDNTNTGTRTIQSGNLNVSTSGSGGARATFQFPTTGKFYFECVYVSGTWSGNKGFGIGTNIADISGTVIPTACVTYNVNGNKTSGGAYTAYGSSYTTTDTVGIAVDQDSGTVTFYKNNTSQGAITHGLSTSNLFPLYVDPSSSGSVQAFNFGQQPFTYTAPSGFLPLNTFNI